MAKEIIKALQYKFDIGATSKIALIDLNTILALMAVKRIEASWLGIVNGQWQILGKQPEIGGFYKTRKQVQEMVDEVLSDIANDNKKK